MTQQMQQLYSLKTEKKYTQGADLKFQKRDLIEFHNWESQSSKQHFLEQNKA